MKYKHDPTYFELHYRFRILINMINMLIRKINKVLYVLCVLVHILTLFYGIFLISVFQDMESYVKNCVSGFCKNKLEYFIFVGRALKNVLMFPIEY